MRLGRSGAHHQPASKLRKNMVGPEGRAIRRERETVERESGNKDYYSSYFKLQGKTYGPKRLEMLTSKTLKLPTGIREAPFPSSSFRLSSMTGRGLQHIAFQCKSV